MDLLPCKFYIISTFALIYMCRGGLWSVASVILNTVKWEYISPATLPLWKTEWNWKFVIYPVFFLPHIITCFICKRGLTELLDLYLHGFLHCTAATWLDFKINRFWSASLDVWLLFALNYSWPWLILHWPLHQHLTVLCLCLPFLPFASSWNSDLPVLKVVVHL